MIGVSFRDARKKEMVKKGETPPPDAVLMEVIRREEWEREQLEREERYALPYYLLPSYRILPFIDFCAYRNPDHCREMEERMKNRTPEECEEWYGTITVSRYRSTVVTVVLEERMDNGWNDGVLRSGMPTRSGRRKKERRNYRTRPTSS